MNKTLKILSLFLALMTVSTALFSCTKLSSSKLETETVMRIGDYEIPYELYRYIVLNFKKDYPDAADDELKGKTEAALLDIYAILITAEKYGLSVNDEYFETVADKEAEVAVEKAGGKDEYKKELEDAYMNDSVFRFLTKKDAVYGELYYAMEEAGKIETDKEKIKALAMSDEFVCVKQVLIVGENPDKTGELYYKPAKKHTNDEAKKIAENVREKALAGENFDSLVRDFGESLYMIQNPDGYYVCRGMWEDGVFDVIAGLETGEISEVCESTAGYSVFLRCEKNEKYVESHTEKIMEDSGKAVFSTEIEKVRSGLKAEPSEKYDSIDIGAMMPGDSK